MLMACCKTAIFPLLMHWRYCSLTLSYPFPKWCLMISENVFFINQRGENHVDGLVQDCSISSANALEILQSCTKLSICNFEVITVPVDGLSLLGAGTSAGTEMTKVCTWSALDWLTSMRIKHLSPLTRDQYCDRSVIDKINSLMPGDLIVTFGQWLVKCSVLTSIYECSVPSHYLNWCWLIVNQERSLGTIFSQILHKISLKKCIWKCHL